MYVQCVRLQINLYAYAYKCLRGNMFLFCVGASTCTRAKTIHLKAGVTIHVCFLDTIILNLHHCCSMLTNSYVSIYLKELYVNIFELFHEYIIKSSRFSGSTRMTYCRATRNFALTLDIPAMLSDGDMMST